MMMPANYSAIAENEMTYVIGGGLLEAIGSITAPVWNASNLKTFNTNIITLIGNNYTSSLVKNTLGSVFRGYSDTTVRQNLKDGWAKMFGTSTHSTGAIVLNVVGTLAAIYNLGRTTVSPSAPSKAYSSGDMYESSYYYTDAEGTTHVYTY